MLCNFCSTHKLILPPLLKNIIYLKAVKINAQFVILSINIWYIKNWVIP